MQINAVITHSDCTWMYGNWGEPGMRRLIDHCTQWGIRKAYLQVFNGGLALYQSRIAEVQHGLKDQSFPGYNDIEGDWDYRTWDMLGAAVDQAHKRGIELHAWYSFLEDNHGGPYGSQFCAEHPEWCLAARDGKPQPENCRTLSYVFPEVRECKLAIVKELLDYDVDGLFFDLNRASGSYRYEKGVWLYGYEGPAVDSFKENHGLNPHELKLGDPRWLDHRSRYLTLFMREVKAEIERRGRRCEVTAHLPFVEPVDYSDPYCYKKSKAADVATCVAEGLVDRCCLHAYASSTEYNNHMTDLRSMVSQLREAVGLTCPVGVALYSYWDLCPDLLEQKANECEEVGCEDLVLFEADTIQRMHLGGVIANCSLGENRIRREICCLENDGAPDGAAWEKAEEISGLVAARWVDNVEPPRPAKVQTQAWFTRDKENLYVRVHCDEPEPEKLVGGDWQRSDPVTACTANDDGVELCLDVEHKHTDYFRFVTNSKGVQLDAKRSDSRWDGEWTAEVAVQDDGFTVQMVIPFAVLGRTPQAGEAWGFNLIRHRRGGLFESSGTSFLVPCTGSGIVPQPSDFRHLVFESPKDLCSQ